LRGVTCREAFSGREPHGSLRKITKNRGKSGTREFKVTFRMVLGERGPPVVATEAA